MADPELSAVPAGDPGSVTGDLVGACPAFQTVLDAVRLVAPVDTTVLLLGETGTGKELVARAIHQASARRPQPFVALSCAAVPSGLLENELFGHERGAYTGAVAAAAGRVQLAGRGTLFLDEIGDLPLELQPKLLRVLQERQCERLGGDGRAVPVEARVIAATNQDLAAMVQERTFRADLYYRLNVFPIRLPPLRERRRDIPLLIAHFVRRFGERHSRAITHIPAEALETLQHYTWPGNIRELQNVIERAVIGSVDGVLRLPPEVQAMAPGMDPHRTLADAERAHILAALQASGWVVGGWNGAAARLGLPRTTLIAKMQRLGLTKPGGRGRKAEAPMESRLRIAD